MKLLFIWEITLLEAFLQYSIAAGGNCGCAPGLKGHKGFKGNRGIKGERGAKGEPGFPGFQGVMGERGLDGSSGEKGLKGRTGPSPDTFKTFGPSGEVGPPGRCLCTIRFSQPVVVNDYYLTDEDGEPIYIGDVFNEPAFDQAIYRTHPTPPPRPQLQPPQISPNYNRANNRLFMLSSTGVLMPVRDVMAYDLFAAANVNAVAETSTTTTTTTELPISRYADEYHDTYHHYPPPNIIYVMGPKGSLIPIDVIDGGKHFKPSGYAHGPGYIHNPPHKPNPHPSVPPDYYHPPPDHHHPFLPDHHHPPPDHHHPFPPDHHHRPPSHYYIKHPSKTNSHGYYPPPPPPGHGHHGYPGPGYITPSRRGSTSYSKWFRNILLGEEDDDPEDDYDTDAYNTQDEDNYEAPEAFEPSGQSFESEEQPRDHTDETEVE